MTSFTCTSRQARTQRVHWIHASRFTAIAGCEMSCCGWLRRAKRDFPTPSFFAQFRSLLTWVYSCSGMSERRSSSTIFCDASARAELVVTSMPAVGTRQHDGARARSPLISTTQARQLPSERWLPPWQRCGMVTPCFLAVSMIFSSGRPITVWPLSLNSMGIMASCWVVTRSIWLLHLLREISHHRQRGVGRRLPKAADRGVHHRLRQLFQQRLVPLALFHEDQRLGGADAARRALAAGLVVEELHQVDRGFRGLVFIGKDHERGRSDKGAVRLQRVEVEW